MATVGAFSKPQTTDIANLLRDGHFCLTFAGVGLRTDLRGNAVKQGWRPFIVGAVGEFAIAGLTLVMVIAAAPLLGL